MYQQYRWLAERWPDRPEVRLGLARCQRRLGRTEEAERLLDALLINSPGNGQALWERGQLELERNRPAAAESWLRKAARALPHDRGPSFSLYRCLLELDRREEADQVHARVTQIDADLKRIAQLSQEVMQRPNDAALRYEGGILFLRNGERSVGIRWLQMALRLDPNCEPARRALAAETARER